MAYLLDTNVLSELRNPKKCHPSVAAWQAGVAISSCFVSVLTYMEIERGILKIRPKDGHFANLLENWFGNLVKPRFEQRTFPVTAAIAQTAAQIQATRSRDVVDSLIAATALELDLTLVT